LTTKSGEALKGIPEEDFQKCFEARNTMEKELEQILRRQSLDFAAF